MSLPKVLKLVFLAMVFIFCSAQAQRITVQGSKFLVGSNPIFMLGANTPWNKWNDFGNNFDSTWWNTHFKSLHNDGLNCTRIWISCDGANASPGISSSGAISAPTQAFWNNLATLFNIARNNTIYLMLAPISFDHSKPGNTNAASWKAMYGSAANRQTFVDNYVIPLVQKFGSNPYFWSIDVGNELDWVFENHGVDTNNVFDLVARVAVGVHKTGEVLVTLGTGAGPKYLSPTFGVNRYSDASLQKLQAGAHLDFYDDHYYSWMKQYFSTPFKAGPAAWKIDEKPCVIGEYSAKGDSSGFSPAECLQKAADLGWLGVMPWTSNGVDDNGSLSDFGSAFKTWSASHASLVFPPLTGVAAPSAPNMIRGALKRNTIAFYNPESGMLQLKGISSNTTVECLTSTGKLVFRCKNSIVGEKVSVPLGNNTARLIIVRCKANDGTEFSQKVICR
jgi:hypothetical protein